MEKRPPLRTEKGQKTIRVIEIRRKMIDPLTAGREELALAISTACEAPVLSGMRESFKSFLDILDIYQGPLAPLLSEPLLAPTETLDSILVRSLLSNPAVHPVIVARGLESRPPEQKKEDTPWIRTRAATRVRAIDANGAEVTLASEEPADVSGFVVDPLAAGSVIANATVGRNLLGLDVYAASGTCSPALFASICPIHPPESVETHQVNGAKLLPLLPEALLRQTRFAVNYYFSGTAVLTAFSQLAAAIRGNRAAIPGLLEAFSPAAKPQRAGRPAKGPTWRQAKEEERLRYLLKRLGEVGVTAWDDPEMWEYDTSPLNELYRVGALGVYLYVLSEGRESEHVARFLEASTIRNIKEAQAEKNARNAADASSRARQYVTIIEDKFGAARTNAVLDTLRTLVGARSYHAPGGRFVSEIVQINDPEAVLSCLSKKEREIVGTEYENRYQNWLAAMNNKCPHVRLVRRLRALSTEKALDVLRELDSYASDRTSVKQKKDMVVDPAGRKQQISEFQWIMCKSCGFRMLCPHVPDRVRLEAQRASYEKIRTSLLKYAVRVRTEGETSLTSYYCRVCSEQLFESLEEDRTAEIFGRFGDLDPDIRKKVWTTAIRAAKNVKFSVPTDDRKFASVATGVTYPLLMAIEERAVKKGRRREVVADDEGVDLRTQLNIVVLVYAYILELIWSSRNAPGKEIGFVDVKIGAKLTTYADQILKRIAAEHRGLLSQIEGITTDSLRTHFAEIYQLVHREGESELQIANPEEEFVVRVTTIDPVYRYATTVACVAGDLPVERPVGPLKARQEFELVFGTSLSKIIKSARENAKNPAFAFLYLQRTEIPPDVSLEYVSKDPRVNLYAELYEPAVGEAALREFQSAGGSAKKVRTVRRPRKGVTRTVPLAAAERGRFFGAYRLLAMYTKKVTDASHFENYRSELALFRQKEKKLQSAYEIAALKPYYDFRFAAQPFRAVTVPLTSVFDEDGLRHEWGGERATFYFAHEKGELEVKGGAAAVKTAREKGEITPGMTLTDIGCPVCGVRASRATDLDEERTRKSVRAVSEIDSFFVFYESRCPEGGLHEWAVAPAGAETPSAVEPSGSRCGKCKLGAFLVKEISGGCISKDKKARQYYDKYVSNFVRERQTARTTVIPDETRPLSAPRVDASLAEKWRPDYSLVLRAAELVNVTPATIEAVGSMERRSYADIVDGRDVPPPPADRADPRIYAADAEVRTFLGDYSSLRNASRLSKLPASISDILKSASIPRHAYPGLSALPTVGTGYYDQFVAILDARPPTDALTFVIQSLCRFVLEVASSSSRDCPIFAICPIFAKQELQNILHSQKLLSKPGSFNWTILEADILPAQIGDIGEDVLEELLVAEAEGEEVIDNPFAGDNVDYDISEDNPNNEPS